MYHFDDELDHPLCTRNQTTEFRAAFSNPGEQQCSHCMELCEGITYVPLLDVSNFDVELLCSEETMKEALFHNIRSPTALFFWKHLYMSKWYPCP